MSKLYIGQGLLSENPLQRYTKKVNAVDAADCPDTVEHHRKRGARFQSARCLTTLSQKEFCHKHGFSPHTLQSWELGRSLPRESAVQDFVHALAREGVQCSPQWLLANTGAGPTQST